MKTRREAHLSGHTFEKTCEQRPTRDGFGEGLIIAGKKDDRVYVLCGDLTESTRVEEFQKTFPDRFIELGVSEQAMAAMGAGLAMQGATPFIVSYAAFSPGRNWEQIRTTIALQNANVKIAGAHSGVSVGADGATHQMTEDIALMRVLPHMIVLAPCDAVETRKAVLAAIEHSGPVYIRLTRDKSPVFTTDRTPFAIGQALRLTNGNDVALIACGPLVHEALLAAKELQKEGIEARVINCPSIKPLDEQTILDAAKECGALVTVEEAQMSGGLGGAVAELLASHYPAPLERIGLMDEFGQSGSSSELLEHYKLTAPWIIKAAKKAVKRKTKS